MMPFMNNSRKDGQQVNGCLCGADGGGWYCLEKGTGELSRVTEHVP